MLSNYDPAAFSGRFRIGLGRASLLQWQGQVTGLAGGMNRTSPNSRFDPQRQPPTTF